MKLYVISAVEKKHSVDVFGTTHPLPLTWAEGMIGVIPVFDNKEDAEKYAGDFPIIEFTVEEE
jgi:hypothetical protein